MMQAYDQDQFDEDKSDMILWLAENWTYESKWNTYLSNMLNAIKSMIEEWKRE